MAAYSASVEVAWLRAKRGTVPHSSGLSTTLATRIARVQFLNKRAWAISTTVCKRGTFTRDFERFRGRSPSAYLRRAARTTVLNRSGNRENCWSGCRANNKS